MLSQGWESGIQDSRLACGSWSPPLPGFVPSFASHLPGENLEPLLMGEIITDTWFTA